MIKINMEVKIFDREKKILPNEVYLCEKFNIKEIDKLKGNIKIIEIDCKNCKNVEGLWKEYDKKGLLPDYFGNNWNAFYDSIFYFEFFEEYDLVVFILNDFNFLMKEEPIVSVFIYKKIKESLAFKIAQKDDNKPPLTYIFNLNGDKSRGIANDILHVYNNTDMLVDVPVYD
jgi:RNAse (barnase) inhibitor barstar